MKLKKVEQKEDLYQQTEYDAEAEPSAKILKLEELIFPNDTKQKLKADLPLVAFSSFVSFLHNVKGYLGKARPLLRVEILSGSCSAQQRRDLVKDFQDNKIQVLLCSLKAVGVGITLTAGRSVILTDPWWNRPIENQAIDRVHRIGFT